MEILRSLSILSLVIIAGVISRYFGIFQKDDSRKLSGFVYYFSLPALFLLNVSRLNLSSIDPILLVGSLAPILIVFSLLSALALLRCISKDNFVLFSLAVVFGSNSFFGLALFENLSGGIHYQEAIITSSVLGMSGIILSLILFEYAVSSINVSEIVSKLSQNPLIIAIFIGVVFSAIGFQQSLLHDALQLLAKTATGLATFILGIFIYDHISFKVLKSSIGISVFRFLSLPLTGYLVITFLDKYFTPVGAELKQFLIIQTGIPAAISLAIFAERYKYKVKELTGLIILTSVFCFLLLGGLFFVY